MRRSLRPTSDKGDEGSRCVPTPAAKAIPQNEQTPADRERVQGPGHPDTLASRINLGAANQVRWEESVRGGVG
jgi:hypothetical protein